MFRGLYRQVEWLTKQFKNLCCRLGVLEQTVAECCEGGGGGGTNPTSTYIPYNNAGTFADSFLVNDTGNSVLKSVYGGNDVGLNLDFANNIYSFGKTNFGYYQAGNTACYFGDHSGSFNNNVLILDDLNGTLQTYYSGAGFGLSFEYTNLLFTIGDYGYSNAGTSIVIDDTNSLIKTQYGGNDVGLKLDFANTTYVLGNIGSGSAISVQTDFITLAAAGVGDPRIFLDGTTGAIIKTGNGAGDKGLYFDLSADAYSIGSGTTFVKTDSSIAQLGDVNSAGNSTRVSVDDAAQRVSVYSVNGLDVQQSYVTNVYTVDGVDASAGYIIPSPGIYSILNSATGGNTLDFPNPAPFIGSEIFITILDAVINCDVSGAVRIVANNNDQIPSNLKTRSTYIFKAFGGEWIGGALFY